MSRLLPSIAVLMLCLSGAPALAGGPPPEGDPPAAQPPSVTREAWIGYQRERLAIQAEGEHYRVVDGYGRALSVRQVARALGDISTYAAADRVTRVQQTTGASATIGGPIVMLLGLSRVSVADRRARGYQRAAGYSMLVAGMAGTAVGIGLLSDRRPRMPSTYYSRDQAERLIKAYNHKLRENYAIPHQYALRMPPPRPRNDLQLSIGLAGLGVRGTF